MLLVDSFRLIPDPDVRLVISGRGGLERELRRAAQSDPRITIAGFLDRQAWRRLLASATVLVNPRLSSALENRYNFPSKLIDYLAAGRPVITTLSGDLDPEYLKITIPLHEETPHSVVGCGSARGGLGLPVLGRFHGTPIPRNTRPLTSSVKGADVVHVIGLRDPVGLVAALSSRRRSIPFVVEPVGMHRRHLRSPAPEDRL
jgi:hypothetical protein